MGIAKVSLILLAPLEIIGIIVVGVISGQATRRNENRLESEGTDETRPGRAGHRRGTGGAQSSGLLPSVVAARCGFSCALSTFRPSACTFGTALRAFRHAPFVRFRLSGWCPDPLAPANAWPF
jgi:hypothetical protein